MFKVIVVVVFEYTFRDTGLNRNVQERPSLLQLQLRVIAVEEPSVIYITSSRLVPTYTRDGKQEKDIRQKSP